MEAIKYPVITLLIMLSTGLQAQFESTWRKSILGGWTGRTGILVADIDKDGQDEIISNAVIPDSYLTNFWYILDGNSSSLAKEQTFVSDLELFNTKRTQLAIVDDMQYYVEGASLDLIAEAFPLQLSIWDITNKTLIKQERIENVLNWIIEDLDGDDRVDLLVFNGDGGMTQYTFPEIHQVKTYTGENSFKFYPKLIDFDMNGQKEIFIASHGAFTILEADEGNLNEVWKMTDFSFTGRVPDYDFYDFDKDGDLEIYGIIQGKIMVFDPTEKDIIFEIPLDSISASTLDDLRIDYFAFADIDGDGIKEIISRGFENIFISDPYDFSLIKTINDTYSDSWVRGIPDIAIGDTDGDGNLEAIWSNGLESGSPPPAHFFIQDLVNEDNFWVSRSQGFYLHNFQIDNFSGGTELQLIHAHPDYPLNYSNDTINFLNIFNLKDKTKVPHKSPFALYTFAPIQWDDDPSLEIINAHGSFVSVYDYPDFELLWSKNFIFPASVKFRKIEQKDIDLDGEPEIVGVLETRAAGIEGASYIVVFNNEMEIQWFIPHLFPVNYFIDNFHFEIGNIDDDPQLEIVVQVYAVNADFYSLVIVDGKTQTHERIDFPEYQIEGFELYDWNKDGTLNGIVGAIDKVDVWDLENKTLLKQIELQAELGYFPLVRNIEFHDFDKDGNSEMVITHDGRIKVLRLSDSQVLWQSRFLGVNLSPNNTLKIKEVDGIPKIYIGTEFTIEEFSFTNFTSSNIFEQADSNIKIYPNPVADKLHYDLTDLAMDNIFYNVIDNQGKILQSGKLTLQVGVINLRELKPGIYYLSLNHKEAQGIYCKKVVRIEE